MRIASFNLQNLRLRRRRGGALHLDGARDGDVPADRGPEAEALDPRDRALTAAAIRLADADLMALQEVFDAATLAHFHDRVLVPSGGPAWPQRICLPGNDARGLAVLSRVPLLRVESHAGLTPADLGLDPVPGVGAADRIFRRDCLEVAVPGLTLFLCHFKAPGPGAAAVRRLEALAVRRLVEAHFPDPSRAAWLVLGDLNEPADRPAGEAPAIAPLLAPFGTDLLARLPEAERWSWHDPGGRRYALPDAMIASPALAARFPQAVPQVIRAGLSREALRHPGPRLPGVGIHRPHASDHAVLVVDLPGL